MSARDRIFISYRRQDAAGSSDALHDRLVDRFGKDTVFMDVMDIQAGEEFPDRLRSELERAAVVLAVMGQAWFSAPRNEWGQRRIDFADDWVRIELATALGDPEIVVIPVLVDGASMAPADAFPPELRELAVRNAATIRNDARLETTTTLIDRIARLLDPDEVTEAQPPKDFSVEQVRRAVTEAVDYTHLASAQVMASTVDEISRVFVGLMSSETDRETVAKFLLERIVGRTLAEISNHVGQVFRNRFGISTSNGAWNGHALRVEMTSNWDREFSKCLMLLPDNEGNVGAAALVDNASFDYYGASDPDQRGPWVRLSGEWLSIGATVGEPLPPPGYR